MAESRRLPASSFTSRYEVTHTTTRMTTKLYGKDLKEYEEMDIESLLNKLSAEELEELNNDVDPDNSLLPPHQRCRDQTEKEPTGPFKREELLRYLEEQAKKERDWDERVPFVKGTKRGKSWVPKDGPEGTGGKAAEEGDMPIELDIDEGDDIDEALGMAGEHDLVDLAGILGMHSMLSQNQYYNAIKGKPQDETTGRTFTGVVKAAAPKMVPDEPPNQTDVEDCIRRLEADDSALTDINLNNMKRVPKERIKSVIAAAATSSHLQKLSLANTAITDAEARGLVDTLRGNKSLTVLNVESNFLSPDLLVQMLQAALENQTLVEFKAENQRQYVLGNQVEMELMQAIEDNETLLRVGIAFQSMEARHRVSEALERNMEKVRLRRLERNTS